MEGSIPTNSAELLQMVVALESKIIDDQRTLAFLKQRYSELLAAENEAKLVKAREYIQSLNLDKEQLAQLLVVDDDSGNETSEDEESGPISRTGGTTSSKVARSSSTQVSGGTPTGKPKKRSSPAKLSPAAKDYLKEIPRKLIESARNGAWVEGYRIIKRLPTVLPLDNKYRRVCIGCRKQRAIYGNTSAPPVLFCGGCATGCIYVGNRFNNM